MEEASKRVFEDAAPSAYTVFTTDNEDATVAAVNKYLLGTGYSAVTHDNADDAIWVTDANGENGIDMQFDGDETGLIYSHMETLKEIRYNNLTDMDKAKLAATLKQTVTTKKNQSGGNINTGGY